MFGLGNNLHDTIAQTPKSFSSKADLLAENTRLTEEMESLRLSLVDHEIIKEENNRLHFELGLKPVGKFISAKVVAKPPQIPLDSLLLNIGANDSVSVGDLVLASERVLIGRIVSVSGNTATAALSSFPDSVSYGYLARTNEALEVVGAGGGGIKARVPIDFDVKVNDKIILESNRAYLLAVIASTEENEASGFKSLLMSLPVDIGKTRIVFVENTNNE